MSSLLGKVVVESRRAIDEIFYSWHKTEVVEGGGYGKNRRRRMKAEGVLQGRNDHIAVVEGGRT